MSLKTGAVSICAPLSTLGPATRAALCPVLMMELALLSRQRVQVGSCGLHVCFACSDPIRILPDSLRTSSLSLSLPLSLSAQLGQGLQKWEMLSPVICEPGHPWVELSTPAAPAERERAPPAPCMGVFLPVTSLGTLSLAPLSGSQIHQKDHRPLLSTFAPLVLRRHPSAS